MKENLKLGTILLIITAIAGSLLGVVNSLTKDAILENSKISKEDLAIIMPAAKGIEETSFTTDEIVKEVYKAVDGSSEIGYVFKVTTKGFHGPIDVVVGIEKDKISGIKILSHSETPGLGAKVEEDKFTNKFKSISIGKDIEMIKVPPTSDNQVEGISGASVSSKAVGTAISDAMRYYQKNVKGEEVAPKEETDGTTGASQ